MNPAVGLLARAHLRRSTLALVLLGVLAGLVGAVVVGTLVLARRTGTSFERLLERSGPGDVIVNTMVEPFAVGDEVLDLPGVERGWSATVSVGRPDVEEETYVAVLSGPEPPDGIYDLPVVEGRRADPDDPAEVVVVERLAAAFGVGPGTVVPVTFLTPEEHTQWDSGFGEPDGPSMDLEVVGVVRTPLLTEDLAPLLATPAFHQQVAPATGVGRATIVELEDGTSGIPAFEDELAGFEARTQRPAGFEVFPQVSTSFPESVRSTVDSTSSVMVTGLLALAGIAAVAGLLALGQAFGRHHDRDLEGQAVERALGLGRGGRTLTRTLPALVSAAAAAALTLAGALLAGRFEPMGGLALFEPAPGWAPNLALAAVGSAALGVLVLTMAAGTARLSERRAALRARGQRRSRVSDRGARAGRPSTAVGVRFALDPGRGPTAVPVRSAIIAVALAIGGVAASAVFTSSLDRLGGTPERWGGRADFDLADADEAEIEAVLDDERLTQISRSDVSTAVDVGDREEHVWSIDPLRGDLSWTVVEGRLPTGEDEVMVGTQVARSTGLDLADQVAVGAGAGQRSLTVVGIGIGRATAGEELGAGVLVSPETRRRLGLDNETTGLLVGVGPDHDAEAVTREYASRYEITARERPLDVEDLVRVGRVPQAVALFIAALGLAALANGLVLAVRRRRRDLAVLRTLGVTPAETSTSIVVMALVWAGLGVLVGIPLGIATGRLLWRVVAEGTGVATDPLTPALVLSLAPAVLAIAVVLSLLPARRAGRLRPVNLLHDE